MKAINLPAGTTHLRFGYLACLIADALHPYDGLDEHRFFYQAARINLDVQLKDEVTRGTLPVKDPLTFGPHTFPHGAMLNGAYVTVDDLRRFLAGRPISIVVGDPLVDRNH